MNLLAWIGAPGALDSTLRRHARIRRAAILLVGFAMSVGSLGARAQSQAEGQHGTSQSVTPHFVVSLRELSLRSQPQEAESDDEHNLSARPPARPLPPDANTGVPWPPIGNATRLPTVSAAQSVSFSPLPAQLFEGGLDNNKSLPPDTDGAVGPNHVVTMLNNGIFIANRAGFTNMFISRTTFWAAAGTNITPFDPKILYDPNSGRWIASSVSGEASTSSSILVAMSLTSDPTGSWVMFQAPADPAGKLWADAPVLGYTKDWVVVTANMAPLTANTIDSTKIFVFNKSDLANGSSIHFTTFTDPDAFSLVPAVTLDPTVSTMYLVQDWNGNANGIGTLRVSTVTGPVGSETYNATNFFPSSANTWQTCKLSCSLGDFATQLGSSRKIAVADSRVSSVTYQNGSLWVAQNASIPADFPDHTTAQWWQMTASAVQQFGRVDGGPGTFYAFPTNVANNNSDMLIGFTSFSSSKYPTAAYAFRSNSDAAGTLRNVVEYKPGENFYYKINPNRDNRNRWGDYSSTVVDPVNGLDMWTLQEYAASPDFIVSGVNYSRWGTYWAKVSANADTVVPQAGWWWDPSLNGIGFFIETGGVSTKGMFMAGFLYDANGDATWLVSNGQMAGSVYADNWLKVTGGQTIAGPYKAPTGNSIAGSLTVTFQDATHAVMTRPDGSQISLVRFSFSTTPPTSPISGSSQVGWWWADPSAPGNGTSSGSGTGYGIEIQASSVFIVAYVYDAAGNPVWYLATGSLNAALGFDGSWDLYAGGPQLTSAEGSATGAHTVIGASVPMSLTFADATHGTLTMGSVAIPITRFQGF